MFTVNSSHYRDEASHSISFFFVRLLVYLQSWGQGPEVGFHIHPAAEVWIWPLIGSSLRDRPMIMCLQVSALCVCFSFRSWFSSSQWWSISEAVALEQEKMFQTKVTVTGHFNWFIFFAPSLIPRSPSWCFHNIVWHTTCFSPHCRIMHPRTRPCINSSLEEP